MVVNVLEELVANPRNTRELQVCPVFVEDSATVIQNDDPLSTYVFKFLNAPQLTLRIRMSASSVGSDSDIRVHDTGVHFESIRLFKDALLIAAISPISSPKK